MGWESVDWISLAQDRDHWRVVMNANEPSGLKKTLEIS
jgi:hypothetical protein